MYMQLIRTDTIQKYDLTYQRLNLFFTRYALVESEECLRVKFKRGGRSVII